MSSKKYLVFWCLAGAILAFDQWTKLLIYTQFQWGESIPVIQNFFNITFVKNPGAAFGFLAKAPAVFRDNFFLILPPIAMLVIVYMHYKAEKKDFIQITALGLIMGGAIGNYVDRLRFGYVVDFLDFHYFEKYAWPAFNVADISIVSGIFLLLLFVKYD
tara:strand:+ start:4949 stop:5425 length:477 start_codon:yes stop_codon:yes gene_type:complete